MSLMLWEDETATPQVISPDSPLPVTSEARGGADFTYGAVSVSTTATQLVDIDATRYFVSINNFVEPEAPAAPTLFVGDADVTAATGMPIVSGAEREMLVTGALYGITASGTVDARVWAEANP